MSPMQAYEAYYMGAYTDEKLELMTGDPTTFILIGGGELGESSAQVTAVYIDGERVFEKNY